MSTTSSWSAIDWANRGGELLATNPRLAQRLLGRAICGLPVEAIAYYNLGIGLHQQRRIPAAIRAYRTSLALAGAPVVEATNNLSQDLLLNGHWAEGWELYEGRFVREPGKTPLMRQHFGEPRSGPFGDGQPLVLMAEQGFGDTLQFCRLALVLQELGHPVSLFCQPALVPLLQEGSDIQQVSDQLFPPDPARPPGWMPLMSVARALGITDRNVPHPGPYIKADPGRVAAWGQRLQRQPGKRLIALHWQGKPGHEHSLYSRGRSMTLADWLPLRQLSQVEFLSVQKGEAAEQLHQAHGLPLVAGQAAISASLDFRDTAAALANCDLLLSSDSGVVHLAGALGVPTWVALRWIPEWRWGLEGSTTPWYGSLRLFRQPRDGDWASVVAEMVAEMA